MRTLSKTQKNAIGEQLILFSSKKLEERQKREILLQNALLSVVVQLPKIINLVLYKARQYFITSFYFLIP